MPKGKALIANNQNRARFEAERDALEKRNAEARDAAEKSGESLDGTTFILIRQSGATGQLYGSVSARDLVDAAADAGHSIKREQVRLNAPIKTLGLHDVRVMLHPEVDCTITVNVARSEDEAERQAAGEDLTGRDEQFEHEATDFEADDVDLSEVFENPDEVALGEDGEEAPASDEETN